MDHYLYALIEGLPPAWRPPGGVGGAPVTVRRWGDRSLITAAIEAVPPPGPRTLATHHEVVASTLDAHAVLPFRYATLAGALGPDGWLASRRDAIDASLALVRGCVEMTVKLLRLDCSVTHHAGGRDGGGDSAPDERELKTLGEHLIAHAELPHARYRPAGTAGNVAASVAFLVPRAELPAFLSRIAPIASRAAGVAVVPTGPWPAYSFVPPFERLPLARTGASPSPSFERRAG